MKAYIQVGSNGMPIGVSAFTAMEGFRQLGIETMLFSNFKDIDNPSAEDIIVGGLGTIKKWFKARGNELPDIDYPKQLKDYYGRRIWQTTSDELLNSGLEQPVFIKPVVGKAFTGFVCNKFSDMIGRIEPGDNISIYCSDVLKIRTEWRVFVRKSKILDIKKYNGELGTAYYLSVVKNMVASYTNAPSAYALDIGLTEDNKTIVIEVNDGYSVGCYGLDPLLYAKFLYSWWAGTVGVEDYWD